MVAGVVAMALWGIFGKIFFIGFLMVLSLSGCGDSTRREPQSKIQLRGAPPLGYIGSEATPYTGVIFKKFSSGQLEYEATYQAGKLEGLDSKWFKNGTLEAQNSWREGRLNGPYKSWFENGQQEFEATFKDNKLDGVYKGWTENGQLKVEEIYREGVKVSQ